MGEAVTSIIDAETVVSGNPRDHKADVRLWLRLLTCTTLVEDAIRSRLRRSFAATLPRFDLMAQLLKAPEGLTLSQLSSRMMVSNGNLTALVERLVAAGHVERRACTSDRRVVVVVLREEGTKAFAKMALAHQGWVTDFFSGLTPHDTEHLMVLLGKLKASTQRALDATEPK